VQILAALIQRTDWSVVDKLLVEPIHATPNSLVAAAEPIAEKTAAPPGQDCRAIGRDC